MLQMNMITTNTTTSVESRLTKSSIPLIQQKMNTNGSSPRPMCVFDDRTPESIMGFANASPAPKGILKQKTVIDPAKILANLTTFSFAKVPPPPPLTTPMTSRKRKMSTNKHLCPPNKITATAGEVQLSKKHLLKHITGYHMFKSYRDASLKIFGVDLAERYKNVILPYCTQRKCAFIPTGVWMKQNSSHENRKGRLWIAVTRRVSYLRKDRLVARPAILIER